eukprot:scaffold858_cov123-Cylindrotheca_fusiformis.AAC.28
MQQKGTTVDWTFKSFGVFYFMRTRLPGPPAIRHHKLAIEREPVLQERAEQENVKGTLLFSSIFCPIKPFIFPSLAQLEKLCYRGRRLGIAEIGLVLWA